MNTRLLHNFLNWGLLLLLLPLQLSATNTDKHVLQRSTFLTAEKALKQGDTTKYSQLKQRLEHYPLLPYLEYQELRQQLKSADDHQINSYLKRYPDVPIGKLLRNTWLDQLAKQQRWSSYLQFYLPSGNTRRHCNYLYAMLKTGEAKQALQQVEKLWLHGDSRPKACDPLFTAWRNSGQLTNKLVWQRITLAMQSNKIGLARYLQRYLPTKDRAWLDHWLQLHQHPQDMESITELNIPSPLQKKILLHGIRQLARKDGAAARSNWHRLAKRHHFNERQQRLAERYLAYAVIREKPPNLLPLLDKLKLDKTDASLAEARLRAALRQRDWKRVERWIAALPKDLRQKEMWRYWDARSKDQQGDSAAAESIWKQLSRERSYHGFLAADLLHTAYQFDHIPLQVDRAKLKQISKLPGIVRAKELYLLDRIHDARREWVDVVHKLDDEKLQAAAQLAYDWGWHERTIFALAQGKQWRDMELRFPLEHRHTIEAMAKQQQLETTWVFAVIRQESAFMQDAYSSAGAMGLMQLMPKTARAEAKKLGLQRPHREAIMQPELNIKLGTAHLRRAMNRLEQNQILATAAYNAGVHRVRSWMPDTTMEPDLWVALVPFRETRSYLQRVLSYSVIYEQRLGLKPQRLAARMAPIRPLTTH